MTTNDRICLSVSLLMIVAPAGCDPADDSGVPETELGENDDDDPEAPEEEDPDPPAAGGRRDTESVRSTGEQQDL